MMMRTAALPLAALLAACATSAAAPTPQDLFFERLSALCGRAYEGRIASPPSAADESFAGKRLIMHVRDCTAQQIRVPFHVGDDRSRTWVISRRGGGLHLAHDHRHEDGSPDRLTLYGGESTGGSAARQEFPADADTRALFVRENIPQSTANVWAIEVAPLFAYELRRPNRFFRIEFDVTRPVAPPPAPWGAD